MRARIWFLPTPRMDHPNAFSPATRLLPPSLRYQWNASTGAVGTASDLTSPRRTEPVPSALKVRLTRLTELTARLSQVPTNARAMADGVNTVGDCLSGGLFCCKRASANSTLPAASPSKNARRL